MCCSVQLTLISHVEVSMATKKRLGKRWCRRQPPRAVLPADDQHLTHQLARCFFEVPKDA